MNKKVKFNLGFIGAGKITSEYLKIFSQMKEVKLSAIHSRNKNKAEDLAKKYTSKPALPSQMVKRSVNALTYQADQAIMHMDYDQFLLSREFHKK